VKILNLDQSTKVTAYAVRNNGKLTDYGEICSDKNERNPVERMKQMYDGIGELLDRIKPNYIVFEQVQYQNNQKVYSQLSQLQGVIFSLLFDRDLGFELVSPPAWRKAVGVVGRNRADQKASIIQIVKERYGLDVSEDIAEAIGISEWSIENIKLSDKVD